MANHAIDALPASAHPRNQSTNRWPQFQEAFGNNFENKVVLDFGGSAGNLLYNSQGAIQESNYISVDPVRLAIQEGQREFPEATFIHYDRYNWMYNHWGNEGINLPTIDRKIDYITAYSVFSHTDFDELVVTLKWMKSLNPEKIVISFLDADSPDIKEYFERKRRQHYGSALEMPLNTHNVYYYIDNRRIISNVKVCPKIDCTHFLALYNIPWLLEELSKEGINASAPHYFAGRKIPFMFVE